MEQEARYYMELAYQEMLKTEKDNTASKPSPLVGAVLVTVTSGVEEILVAHRCQTRDGYHAEETLLDRLNPHRSFSENDVLFVTLEPCTPESRSPDKKCCAQRIVDARIRKVYIGMFDPNPAVYKNGVDFLLNNHIAVELFDADITARIKAANKEFCDYFGENDTYKYSLLNKTILPKLSVEAIQDYCNRVGISGESQIGLFWDKLLEKKLIRVEGKKVEVDDFVLIAFGTKPSLNCDGAEISLKVLFEPGSNKNPMIDRQFEKRDSFDGPMFLALKAFEGWVNEYVPQMQNRTGYETINEYIVPWESLKEAFLNAVIHRAYHGEFSGSFIIVTITDDSITISNPCKLNTKDVKLFQEFKKQSVPPNPYLVRFFQEANLVQRNGYGMDTFRTQNPMPLFEYSGGVLSIVFPFSKKATGKKIEETTGITLDNNDVELYSFIRKNGQVSRIDVEQFFNISSRTANYRLKKLVDYKIITMNGVKNSKNCYYEIK